MKSFLKSLSLGLIASVLVVGAAFAATQPVTANIAFETVLALVKNSDINFGRVVAGTAATYTITPAGSVSTVGGTIIGGTPTAASITVSGSTTQTVSIQATNYAANSGVTPSAGTCTYDGGTATACSTAMTGQAAPGSGKTLLVGVTVSADGNQTNGSTAAPTFDVIVIYG